MTKKYILIVYDPDTANGGEGDENGGPFDLLGYLENEMNNHDIRCLLIDASDLAESLGKLAGPRG